MRALALLAGLWWAAAPPPLSPAPRPPPTEGPAIGRFLIANRRVEGYFAETVIVLADHGAHGSLGLIVNRPAPHTLAELLPELPQARGRNERAWLGGPVAQDQLLLLIRAAKPPHGAAPVLDDVHVSGSRDTLVALLEHPEPAAPFRAYLGYAGWAPGQLASEIARGDWTLAPGDAASVFAADPSGLWERLLRRREQIRVRAPSLLAARAKSITLSPPWRSAAASSACPTSGRAPSSTR